MRLVVVGAAGRVGRRVVRNALADGHEVRALVRDPARAGFEPDDRLHVVTGDVLAPSVAEGLVRGADAVVSAVGDPPGTAPRTLRTEAVRAVVRAMDVHGIPRIVVIGAALVLPADETGVALAGERLACDGAPAALLADHRGAWEALRDSGLDWTLICPPAIADGPPTGRYRWAVDGLPAGGTRISAADVADFVRAALAATTWHQARVGLAD
jgi:putative NADH-flavin reductase